MVDVCKNMSLQRPLDKLGDGLFELLHLPRELDVLVDVPAAGGGGAAYELEAMAELVGEVVQLPLAMLGELDA